ncbi:uncharacterized protein TNCV_5067961 [Trichonephila clavipes]|uniref:Uncharacterized protein n=1 Tax=Trichonephila clavipes TaxID=2585209 RepID=A0A8X6RD59_TRICX|nr:uncharacterized protein TNCV_5067961 [Trichonephila clavipes]
MGNILVQPTKLSSKPLDNLTELELRTVLDTLLEIKEKFENIKQAYFEIDNDDEFKDVEPLLLNKIDEDIQEFQKTFVDSPLKTYRLTTVTYGTICAPFLATRTLLQLSEEEKQNFPLASPIVKNDFYVDDVPSGAPDLEIATKTQQQLIGRMNVGEMHLYKWCSNSCHLLSNVSTDDREYVGNDDHTSMKALRLS